MVIGKPKPEPKSTPSLEPELERYSNLYPNPNINPRSWTKRSTHATHTRSHPIPTPHASHSAILLTPPQHAKCMLTRPSMSYRGTEAQGYRGTGVQGYRPSMSYSFYGRLYPLPLLIAPLPLLVCRLQPHSYPTGYCIGTVLTLACSYVLLSKVFIRFTNKATGQALPKPNRDISP